MIGQIIDVSRHRDTPTSLQWILLSIVVVGGIIVRFWGLGNIGLHGDEEIMALAARSLSETGQPILPSGMYYGRAFPQLYLMAGSISLFGESEWAFRLPSAFVGVLAIPLAFWLGLRFLTVNWSIAFAIVIASLPFMIALSQTARMYGFYVTGVMLLAVAIFRWEKTGSWAAYLGAIGACLIALSFHTLTAFAMLLFFYPAITQASVKKLALGAIAFVFCLAAFEVYSSWISSQYYSLVTIPGDDDSALSGGVPLGLSLATMLSIAAAAALATIITYLTLRKHLSVERSSWLSAASGLYFSAFVLIGSSNFHLAAWFFGLSCIAGMRGNIRPWVLPIAGLALCIFTAIFALWRVEGSQEELSRLVLTLLGTPSPWPLVVFAQFAPVAVILYGIVALYLVARFALGEKLPDHLLFATISVLTPLLLIGFFRGHIPERYVVGFLPFFVLAVLAGVQAVLARLTTARYSTPAYAIALAIVFVAFVNPVSFIRHIDPQYEEFPALTDSRGEDHKGAAEFVLAQNLDANDIVVALDAQQQYYYLGNRLDYYLRSLNIRRNSSFMSDEVMVNLYTGTPQISHGRELAKLFDTHRSGRVFIIGSASLERNIPRYMGDGIWETMRSYGVEKVYEGRDGATTVWQYNPEKSDSG